MSAMLLLCVGAIQQSLIRAAARKAVPHTCNAYWDVTLAHSNMHPGGLPKGTHQTAKLAKLVLQNTTTFGVQ
jgi:hypothetical protein